jgi:hypothetical protein
MNMMKRIKPKKAYFETVTRQQIEESEKNSSTGPKSGFEP